MHDDLKAPKEAKVGRKKDKRRAPPVESKPSFNEVHQRIQLATNTKTQNELAEILDIRQSSISDAKRRNRIPSSWYMLLFEKLGISQDWLRYGLGPIYLRTEQGYELPASLATDAKESASSFCEPAAKSSLVTVYSMLCQPRVDSMPELDPIGKLALPANFASSDTLVLRMHSNDMAPTVQQGAYVGINTAETHPLSGCVCVLMDEQVGMLMRRIFLDYGSKSFLLRSDNDKCPESTVPFENLVDRIIGRVHWVMQEVI